MFENIRADLRRYDDIGGWYRHLGFFITLTYRFGYWSYKLPAFPYWPLRILFKLIYRVVVTPWRFCRHVYLSPRAEIGPGLCLEHPHSILVPPGCSIGKGCTIFHEVTLGLGYGDDVPQLGDSVSVFCGARVFGGISIGDHARVGANAIVQKDVPEWATVLGPIGRSLPGATTKAMLDQRKADN